MECASPWSPAKVGNADPVICSGKLKRGVPQRRGLAEGKEQDGDKEEVPLIIMDAPVWIHLPKLVYW